MTPTLFLRRFCHLGFCCIAAICALQGAEPATPKNESSTPSADVVGTADAAAKSRPKGLVIGMSSEEVEKLIGKAHVIEPMETPEGPAEVWIYRRLAESKSEMVQVGSKPIVSEMPNSEGAVRPVVMGQEPIMKMVRHETYEVVRVLMFKGQFVNLRKVVEKRDVF